MKDGQKTYCRACGENKGHNFGQCKNTSGIKRLLALQEHEFENVRSELKRLRDIDTQINALKGENSLLHRILFSLLDLAELKRK